MPKHKTQNTFYWITWEANTASGNEIWPVYVTLQGNFFIRKILWKMWPGN